MSLDVKAIGTAMIDAARAEAAGRWPQLKALADVELRRLAQSFVDLAGKVSSGEIKETHARQLAHMHQGTARTVLLTLEGVTKLAAEQAIQAGIRAVAKVVNSTVKFTLL